MIRKLLVAGAIFAAGGLQALSLRVGCNNEVRRCVLNERNCGRAEFDNNVVITITAQPQEDGSIIANLVVNVDGQEHVAPTVIVPASEVAVLTCQDPATTTPDIISLAIEPVEVVSAPVESDTAFADLYVTHKEDTLEV